MQLSPHRTFVVQLAAGTHLPGGRMAGRVEHVVSHHATDFDSLEALLAFIARVVREVDGPPSERDAGGSSVHHDG